MYDVTFREMPAADLIAINHRGSYAAIGQAFETLGALVYARGLFEPGQKMFGVYYDDPDTVAEKDLRSAAGFTTTRPDLSLEPPLHQIKIAGGRYAVLTHKGPYADLGLAYQWLYRTWLASANVEIRNEPALEIYLNTPRDAAPQDLITEICIPVV